MQARATGGSFFEDTGDVLLRPFAAHSTRPGIIMCLNMSSNPAIDGKYRTIEVKVGDPKAVVRARKGYWAVR